jgi:hypothetical protein
LAQALAQGQGYRLTSSAVTQILPTVPPGFPAILSIVFRFSPEFPANVFVLKSVSIVAMIGAGLTTFWYFARVRQWPWRLATGIALATVLTPALVFLATATTMAECVFTLGELVTILVMARAVRGDAEPGAAPSGTAALAAASAVATMLVRATGLAVLMAAVLLLLKKRRWRSAAVFVAAAILCYAPWALYARAHQSTPQQRIEHGGPMAQAYSDLILIRVSGSTGSGRATLGDFATRVVDNVTNVFARDVLGILFPALLRTPDESGMEVVSLGRIGLLAGSMGNGAVSMTISLVLAAIALAGWMKTWRERVELPELLVPLTVAMVVIFPVWPFRYVAPLAPFVIGYFIAGLRTQTSDPWRFARVALLSVIGLNLYDHTRYALDLHNRTRVDALDWVEDSREVDELLGWMKKNLVLEGAVATSNPALVYLHTGRKTVAIDDCAGQISVWRAHGVKYLVSLRPADLPTAPSCGPYRVLYTSARRHLWVLEI